jgi:HIV Tat-specific factor 1
MGTSGLSFLYNFCFCLFVFCFFSFRKVHSQTVDSCFIQLDESLAEQQSAIYAVEGIDEREPVVAIKKKRKVYTTNEDGAAGLDERSNKKAKAEEKKPPAAAARKNTAVYVTNLPPDTTEEEIKEVFSKYGVISEEIDRGKPRIRLYRNEDGTLKGDALVIYFRPESVNLAIQMLDDSPLRIGAKTGAGCIHVQAADFSYKAQQDAPTKTSKKEKRKIIAKTQKLNRYLDSCQMRMWLC